MMPYHTCPRCRMSTISQATCSHCGFPFFRMRTEVRVSLADIILPDRGPNRPLRNHETPYWRRTLPPPLLSNAVADWCDHHRSCLKCSQHDWYEPGSPRACAPDEPMAGELVWNVGGAEIAFVDGPDDRVLCVKGRQLFRLWRRLAVSEDMAMTKAERKAG